MNPLWTSLYDRFKDRRYGALFLVAFLAPFAALLVLIAGGLTFLCRGISAALAPGPAHPRFPPLSSDELRVARSRLTRTRERKGA